MGSKATKQPTQPTQPTTLLEPEEEITMDTNEEISTENLEALKASLEEEEPPRSKSKSSVDIGKFMSEGSLKTIGRSTTARVFTNLDRLDMALKKSVVSGIYEHWQLDASTQMYVREELHENYHDRSMLKYVDIPKIHDIAQLDDLSWIVMDRVSPPRTDPATWERFSGMAVHCYLHIEKRGKEIKDVGLTVGRDVVTTFFKDLDKIDRHLGTFLGFIQFCLQYDGHGLKLILGTTQQDTGRRPRIYVIGFNRLRTIESKEDLLAPFQTDYFPFQSTEFKRAYAHAAESFGRTDDAAYVLKHIK